MNKIKVEWEQATAYMDGDEGVLDKFLVQLLKSEQSSIDKLERVKMLIALAYIEGRGVCEEHYKWCDNCGRVLEPGKTHDESCWEVLNGEYYCPKCAIYASQSS